jgi:hypothetical protein
MQLQPRNYFGRPHESVSSLAFEQRHATGKPSDHDRASLAFTANIPNSIAINHFASHFISTPSRSTRFPLFDLVLATRRMTTLARKIAHAESITAMTGNGCVAIVLGKSLLASVAPVGHSYRNEMGPDHRPPALGWTTLDCLRSCHLGNIDNPRRPPIPRPAREPKASRRTGN